MSGGMNSDAELRILEDEVELEKKEKIRGNNLIESINAVMLTEILPSKNGTLEKGELESGEPNQSPVESFPSLSSRQNSKGEEENPIVPLTNRVKIL